MEGRVTDCIQTCGPKCLGYFDLKYPTQKAPVQRMELKGSV